MIGGDAIEIVARRVPSGVELDLIIAAGAHPAALRRRGCAVGNPAHQGGERRRARGRSVDPAHGHAGRDEVQVVVDEAGGGEAAFEIDDLGARSPQAQDVRIAAGCKNLALPHGESLADALLPAAPDPAIDEDKIGFYSERHSQLPPAGTGRAGTYFLQAQGERLQLAWPIRFWHQPMQKRHTYFD